MKTLDLLIVGAGPAGLSVAIEAHKAGLDYEVIERGALTNSIVKYPLQMTFFSTPELLAIGDVPFTSPHRNPSRLEGLTYYRNVTEHFGLRVSVFEEVKRVTPTDGLFEIVSSERTFRARNVVVATGYFDSPNMLGIPGEELPKVSHYYSEAAPFYKRKVAVIGSQNSSVEAALDLYQSKAEVTLIARAPSLGASVKYWLKPNLENRIRSGAIEAYFDTELVRVEEGRIEIRNRTSGESQWLENDFVFALTGYHPDVMFLGTLGIAHDPMTLIPEFNSDTFETSTPGLFIAGSVACGCETGTIFIENGKLHAYTIVGVIKRRLAEARKTRAIE